MYAPLLLTGDYTAAIITAFLFGPVFWALPVIIPHIVSKKYGLNSALILFPFFYLSQEILQFYLDFGITYVHLGFGLANNSIFLGIHPYLGLEGGSLLVLGFNVSLVFLYTRVKSNGFKFNYLIPTFVFVLVIVGTYFFQPSLEKIQTVNVAVFQPNKTDVDGIENNLVKKIDLLENELKKNQNKKIDLIICSESYLMDMEKHPLVVNDIESHFAMKRLMSLSSQYDVIIFSGATLVQLFKTKKPPTASAKKMTGRTGVYFDIYNGSVFITPDQKVSWRTKQRLVPFSESIPFYAFFNYLEEKGWWPERIEKTYGIVPFEGPFEYKDLSIAPIICFESAFPSTIQSLIQDRANLVVILSTTWTDSEWIREQQQDAMPVIQRSFGKTLIYATLDQESSVIDQSGGRRLSSKIFEVKSIDLFDASSTYTSLASRPWIWWLVNFALFVALYLRKKLKLE